MTDEIVRATVADAQMLTDITFASKRHWGYPDEVMTQWHDQLTVTPNYIEANVVYMARIDGAVAGYYSLIRMTDETMLLDNLFVQPAFIGRGVGSALLQHALAEAERLGAACVELESEPHAVDFYRRMGARQIGEKELIAIEGQRRIAPIMAFELSNNAALS